MPMVPSDFSPVIGQHPARELLTQALNQQRIATAYLFAGPPGVGRALMARQFIRLLLGVGHQSLQSSQFLENHPDILWVEPTYLLNSKLVTTADLLRQGQSLPKTRPQIRLEQIRQISQFLSRPPLESPRAVVVIDQAETMAEAAANGLLKTLEEPGRATLILIAPSESSLLPTLVSRCQRIPFYRLTQAEMSQVLHQAGAETLLSIPTLVELAAGSPGAALIHWHQWQTIPSPLCQACLGLTPPLELRYALDLAREISQTLEMEAQLWLVDMIQHHLWRTYRNIHYAQAWEAARMHLKQYVQPRLVWEVAFLTL